MRRAAEHQGTYDLLDTRVLFLFTQQDAPKQRSALWTQPAPSRVVGRGQHRVAAAVAAAPPSPARQHMRGVRSRGFERAVHIEAPPPPPDQPGTTAHRACLRSRSFTGPARRIGSSGGFEADSKRILCEVLGVAAAEASPVLQGLRHRRCTSKRRRHPQPLGSTRRRCMPSHTTHDPSSPPAVLRGPSPCSRANDDPGHTEDTSVEVDVTEVRSGRDQRVAGHPTPRRAPTRSKLQPSVSVGTAPA